jgi:hypothetical protein
MAARHFPDRGNVTCKAFILIATRFSQLLVPSIVGKQQFEVETVARAMD